MTIAVNVSNNPGISGFTISVAFSNSVFEFDSIAVNSDIISSITDNVIVKDNVCTVTATYFSANGDFTDNGELFGIKLKVRENAEPGEYLPPAVITRHIPFRQTPYPQQQICHRQVTLTLQ